MIKSQKGITLTSLVVYIITMLLVLSILAMITQFFMRNKDILTEQSQYIAEYNKFNMYFVEDVKANTNFRLLNNGSEITEYKVSGNLVAGNQIVFTDTGVVYTYQENGIYRDKVKICSNIDNCAFTKDTITDAQTGLVKKIVGVTMVIRNSQVFYRTNEYVLKYW